MRRKTEDPRRIALTDQARKAMEVWQREYARLRRVWNRVEKARKIAERAQKRLEKYDQEQRETAARSQ